MRTELCKERIDNSYYPSEFCIDIVGHCGQDIDRDYFVFTMIYMYNLEASHWKYFTFEISPWGGGGGGGSKLFNYQRADNKIFVCKF